MTYHSPPVMVAIGLLGDEAEGNQSATTRWIGGALHLPEAEGHPHFGENLPRLLQADILRLPDHDDWFPIIVSPRPPRCGMAPCCRGS
jgi:hypothetical protein